MHDEIQNGSVHIALDQGIATLSFAHPAQNALPGRLLSALSDAVEALGRDTAVQVIILKSEGARAFCAGASFGELSALEDFGQSLEFFSGFARVINAMRKCPKFIIGRVHGKAVGGGVGLAAATDYCLASADAAIKLSELAVGFGPFVVGPAIERKIGTSAMSQLAIAASTWKSARWAMEKGLYADVYDTIPELDAAVGTLARQLSTSNPEAMQALKSVCWQGTEDWDALLAARAVISARLALSPFTKAAIAAFKSGQKY